MSERSGFSMYRGKHSGSALSYWTGSRCGVDGQSAWGGPQRNLATCNSVIISWPVQRASSEVQVFSHVWSRNHGLNTHRYLILLYKVPVVFHTRLVSFLCELSKWKKINLDGARDPDFEPSFLLSESWRDHWIARTPSTPGIFAYCPLRVKNNFPLINQVQALHFRQCHRA